MQRLDKLLASQGMLSRREVKELITKGRVTIDGTVEKHPERKVTGEEQIVVAGELLRVQRTADASQAAGGCFRGAGCPG